jgi:hypothetical protein
MCPRRDDLSPSSTRSHSNCQSTGRTGDTGETRKTRDNRRPQGARAPRLPTTVAHWARLPVADGPSAPDGSDPARRQPPAATAPRLSGLGAALPGAAATRRLRCRPQQAPASVDLPFSGMVGADMRPRAGETRWCLPSARLEGVLARRSVRCLGHDRSGRLRRLAGQPGHQSMRRTLCRPSVRARAHPCPPMDS